MPDFTKRVRKSLDLPSGETVVQAAVAQPSGTISRGFAEKRTSFGAVASSVASKMSADSDEVMIADRVPTKNGYLVVTDQRVIWADQKKTGSVGDVAFHFEFNEIDTVTIGDGGGMSNKLLSVSFVDGSSVDLAVAKGQKPDELYAAMRNAIS